MNPRIISKGKGEGAKALIQKQTMGNLMAKIEGGINSQNGKAIGKAKKAKYFKKWPLKYEEEGESRNYLEVTEPYAGFP